ncbi:MAG: hypothetical protein KDA25_06455 [Phycisphaerales bacterium]|nr:hypothetical protein [Phycisphaerales bacterium]
MFHASYRLVWISALFVVGCASRPAMDAVVIDARDQDRLPATARIESPASKRVLAGPTDARVIGSRDVFEVASGGAPIVVDFDDLPPGATIGDWTVAGVTLHGAGAPLLVVRAHDTFTPATFTDVPDPARYRLIATSGAQILSPGGIELAPGPNPAVENDDVTLVFDPPVAAVGFDVLTPSADGMSFVTVTAIGSDGAVLWSGSVDLPRVRGETRYAPPGAGFWGIVAEACVIREVRVDETDGDAACPDSNIGIDSIRFAPTTDVRGADLDGNAVVDAADLGALLVAWRESGVTAAASWRAGDLNRDRRVDATDVLAWLDACAAE